ncbi:MAG: hypothetical protein GXO04_01795 [Aquificae bacterium]|nr:hypothetical protein [Aquificota bacterium]
MFHVKEEDILARSVKIEPAGEPRRCSDAENSKFWCMDVKIVFDNGQERTYTLRGYSEPKELENFLNNKKNLQDILNQSYVLLKNGEIRVYYPKVEELSEKFKEQKPKRRTREKS